MSVNVGPITSLTIGADGLGLISCHDAANGDLKVAHCENVACDTANPVLTTPDSDGDTGSWSSVTIGADGLGIISYRNGDDALAVAHCSDVACSSATLYTVDASAQVVNGTAVTIGTDGSPLISYHDDSDVNESNLKVAHCAGTFCVPYQRRR